MTIADVTATAVVPASGTVTLSFRPTGRQVWIVSQVSVSGIGVGGSATGQLYRDTFPISPFIAQSDAISGDPPVRLGNQQTLRVVWSGATPGAQVNALVIYDDGN